MAFQPARALLPCSFWLVDAYALAGRFDDACELFERLLALRNDVGLLSEEYDIGESRLVGNFPQAFSHLALVNSAYTLNTLQSPRSGTASGARQPDNEGSEPDASPPIAGPKLGGRDQRDA